MEEKELQLVTFEQAKKLKEFGFDWVKNLCYEDGKAEPGYYPILTRKLEKRILFPAPPTALALKWLRDKKKLFGYVYKTIYDKYCFSFYLDDEIKYGQSFETWEAAEIALLDELLDELQIPF
jgi:hypothetical protein